ncbi:MAG TPA: hypothetical protein VGA98_11555 [Allosphingosinicella sp.]
MRTKNCCLRPRRLWAVSAAPGGLDPFSIDALERLAARVESLAEQIERGANAS